MSEPVLVDRRDDVAIVTLHMPEKRNALGEKLYSALSKTLTELQDDLSLRALVLYGGKQFCAGGDLSSMTVTPLAMRQAMGVGHRSVRALVGGRLPVVAAVEGNAYGAGFSLAMACDFVVGDETTTFCAAFGRVGLTPDYGLLWTLPQRVGIAKAREMLMLCDPIKGEKAHALQLIDRFVESGHVFDAAVALAQRLALAPPATISTTKAILSRLPLSLDTMLAWESDTQSLLVRTNDVAEGIRAFAERRSPRFRGE
ncbi:enoyl-CoA hydratase/carnithine racemase [Povalibacter uvarum]|uniref:Enoyl-CoA hydratase/carnithine racemase n=1 Tax=Povalibacter uvarum TaxID=732238 RepID=A0A841HRW9_9GAMM|nr:enoyl-CoA hydratase/isomerase family protein [Povalibacter uvarum]MBB6095394.1 enoyl-CoA hydratase/carnithine racemase [Povalibacter uvarum]